MAQGLNLGFGLHFDDLYCRGGLAQIDGRFLEFLTARNADAATRLKAARTVPESVAGKAESELIVELTPEFEDFIATLFGIAGEVTDLRSRHEELAPLYTVKRVFVQRRAAKKCNPAEAAAFDGAALRAALAPHVGGELTELRFAQHVDSWMKAEAEHAEALDLATRYAAWAVHSPQGQAHHAKGVLFKIPAKVDPQHLIPIETEGVAAVPAIKLPEHHCRARNGFALTDAGTDLEGSLDHANYCIWCHNQGKDSCSKGLREKTGEFKKSPFGVPLAGCPLEEKISEMNLAEAQGHTIGALPSPSSTTRCAPRPATASATTA